MAAVQVAVLVSGSGTILEALLDADLPIAVVIADRPCRGLHVTHHAGVAGELVDRREVGGFSSGFDREAYTQRIVDALDRYKVDLVVMAGFGTVLTQTIHDRYPGRILNTHPSLLPAFPGWHAVAEVLDAGVSETGCTVHLAALEVDAGPILAQQSVPVLPGDTVEMLHERIKAVERLLYPETIRAVIEVLEAGGEPFEVAGSVKVEEER